MVLNIQRKTESHPLRDIITYYGYVFADIWASCGHGF